MNITPEMARTELSRRRALRTQSLMPKNNNITPEMARAELERRRSLQVPQNPTGWAGVGEDVLEGVSKVPESLYNMASQAPGEIYGVGEQLFTDPKRFAQNVGGGFGKLGQGILNTPANISDYLVKKDILPKEYGFKWRKEEPEIPFAEMLGRKGSKKGDALIEGMISSLPYMAGATSIPGLMARTAAHSIGQNENPITSSLTAGIPITGAKALYKGGKAVGQYGAKVNRSFPVEKPIEQIISKKTTNENIDNKNYNDFRKETKGISIKKTPEINIAGISEGAGKTEMRNINRFIDGNKSIDQAIKSDQELSKILRSIEGKKDKGPKDRDAAYYARKGQERLRKSIKDTLKENGKKGLQNEYERITAFHAKNVQPYRHPLIEEHIKGRLTTEDLARKLSKNDLWRATGGKNHPELYTNQSLTGKGTALMQHGLAHMIGGLPANAFLILRDILKGRR